MDIITRFAPSPTGDLHLGHALAAKVARDLASTSLHGKFLLRYEDIDLLRIRSESYLQIEEDLKWLGILWDEVPLRQSYRLEAYARAFQKLRELEMVYPCFCTRKEIQGEISRIQGAPQDECFSVYPGICRGKDREESFDRINRGESHSWRLDSHKAAKLHGNLFFTDLRFGIIEVDPSKNGDVILARKDLSTSYHLAVVVDDDFQGVTHVTRGEDLLDATHTHRQLQSLLKLREPIYHHHRLICDSEGKRLAKRNFAHSIRQYRTNGLTAGEVIGMLEEI